MRIQQAAQLVLPLVISVMTLCTSGCSTTASHPSSAQLAANFLNRQTIVATTRESYPPKNPQRITVFTNKQAPLMPYRIIGIATVSKFNLIGMARKKATVHEMMKKLAASVGGDGIINMHDTAQHLQAHVIAFQKILI